MSFFRFSDSRYAVVISKHIKILTVPMVIRHCVSLVNVTDVGPIVTSPARASGGGEVLQSVCL